MNATYKVVYNKARGALMVVNEMTSCIRSKGTKTVAAAAVAAMIAGLSGAAAYHSPGQTEDHSGYNDPGQRYQGAYYGDQCRQPQFPYQYRHEPGSG